MAPSPGFSQIKCFMACFYWVIRKEPYNRRTSKLRFELALPSLPTPFCAHLIHLLQHLLDRNKWAHNCYAYQNSLPNNDLPDKKYAEALTRHRGMWACEECVARSKQAKRKILGKGMQLMLKSNLSTLRYTSDGHCSNVTIIIGMFGELQTTRSLQAIHEGNSWLTLSLSISVLVLVLALAPAKVVSCSLPRLNLSSAQYQSNTALPRGVHGLNMICI
jgi:hypothetical protein